MPGNRLLVVADSKMLPALANGLREGGKFEVVTVSLADSAAAQAAAATADALALFYGAPGAPLPAALQSLAPRVRERGGRVVAVLQREQAAQRDDCFRAGCSEVLFMPMPKEQFVARLNGALGLSWPGEAGAQAPVAVATRNSSSKLEKATVSATGIEAQKDLPLKPGDTVRLSWDRFQQWGLVVRGGPSAQIRFAGVSPDEETQIREWLKSGGKPAPAAAPASAKPAEAPKATAPAAPAGPRAAPAAGPPPGFADRKPVRPQTASRPPVRVAPPVVGASATAPSPVPPAGAAGVSSPPPPPPTMTPAAVTPVVPPVASAGAAPPTAPAAAGNGMGAPALSGLFDDSAAAAGGGPAQPAAPAGPPWPVPVTLAACKVLITQLLRDKTVPGDAAPALAASARKVTGMLSLGERTALERAGLDSVFGDAVATRIVLDAATAEGLRLFSAIPAPTLDGPTVAAMTKQADEVAGRLQKEANAAVGKGAVENLQMVTAASAALSREMLSFKETADRLRGVGASPRMGAGALDPEMVLPGQAPRPRAPPSTTVAPVKAELRDFRGLDQRPGRSKAVIATLLVLAAVVAAAYGFYFTAPHHGVVATAAAGEGVVRIDVSGESALVTVTPEWVVHSVARVQFLCNALRDRDVTKAVLMLPTGATVGLLEVATGRITGAPKPL